MTTDYTNAETNIIPVPNRSEIVRITTHYDEIVPSRSDTDPLARKLYRQGWKVRRTIQKQKKEKREFLSPYVHISMTDWLNLFGENDRHLTIIDGHYHHSTMVNKLHVAMKFEEFRDGLPNSILPITYWTMESKSPQIYSFLGYVSKLDGFEVNIKSVREVVQNDPELITILEENAHAHPIIRQTYGSFSVDVAVHMIDQIYDDVSIKQILLFSRDPDLIPALRSVKTMDDVKIALVWCNDVFISGELLEEVDYLIDMRDMVATLKCGEQHKKFPTRGVE
jgi:uncharacterized LabA/DUF88 family protein